MSPSHPTPLPCAKASPEGCQFATRISAMEDAVRDSTKKVESMAADVAKVARTVNRIDNVLKGDKDYEQIGVIGDVKCLKKAVRGLLNEKYIRVGLAILLPVLVAMGWQMWRDHVDENKKAAEKADRVIVAPAAPSALSQRGRP